MKLIDVYPDDYPDPEPVDASKRVIGPPTIHLGGYQQLLRGKPMRAKFRNSWEKPQPLEPGKATDLNFTMPDVESHPPQGTPDHGSDPKLMVPLGGS